jgi:hypothetical protein
VKHGETVFEKDFKEVRGKYIWRLRQLNTLKRIVHITSKRKHLQAYKSQMVQALHPNDRPIFRRCNVKILDRIDTDTIYA